MTISNSIQSAMTGLAWAHVASQGAEKVQARAESFQQKVAELESKAATPEGAQQIRSAANSVADRYTAVLESLVSDVRSYLKDDQDAGKAFERGMQNIANEGTAIRADSRAKLEAAYNRLAQF